MLTLTILQRQLNYAIAYQMFLSPTYSKSVIYLHKFN